MDEGQRRSAPPRADEVISEERFQRYHAYARRRGVNWPLYLLARLILQPAFRVWLRLSRVGREHLRGIEGGVIIASNHRSFLDPFVIGCTLPWRRPMQYVAKVELFESALARVDPLPGRGLPHPARAVGRDRDGDRAPRPRPRRHRLHLPRGDAHPVWLAGHAEARRRPPGAGDRCRGRPRRRARDRAGAARLADPAAEGDAARRQAGDVPAHRAPLAGPRRHRHRADLAQRRAPVGVARRPAAACARRP